MNLRMKRIARSILEPVGLFPHAQRLYRRLAGTQAFAQPAQARDEAYLARIAQEQANYAAVVNVHDLPEIFHYWSNKYLLPKCQSFGFNHPDEHFANNLAQALPADGEARFVSVGAGNCDTEVRVASLLRARGHTHFTIECLDINPHMLARGRELAEATGVAANIRTVACDFNQWSPQTTYHAVMANQSLHHVVELENLFDAIDRALLPEGKCVISDTIGRNGHLRWPEALLLVREFWKELPLHYRHNLQLNRQEDEFMDWDCSDSGFEGIRAQDILPLLVERFHFHSFLPFANVIDPFIDRGFGHHFSRKTEWDLAFIDRVHARDEAEILAGRLKPTHMFAVLGKQPADNPQWWSGLSPQSCIRNP